jgi:hypothetical protein
MPDPEVGGSGRGAETGNPAQPAIEADHRGAIVGGDNYGIVSTGDNAVNSIIQIHAAGEASAITQVVRLTACDVPVLRTFPERDPVGRDEIVDQVAAEIAAGQSVQFYGPPMAGKKAVARAVMRRLGAGREPPRGVELLPQGDQPHTLGTLYARLTEFFFQVTTYEPPEPRLRAAVTDVNLTAVIVIGDCELPAEDLTRLLGTFPDCSFLLTSTHRTLYRTGAAYEIGPLSLADAFELVAQETGMDHDGLRRLRVTEAYELTAGQPHRLVQYAAFLRAVQAKGGGPDPLSVVPPAEQARMLAAGLSEPARALLVAFATFGPELPARLLLAVTGLPARPAAGPDLDAATTELLITALITRAGDASEVRYRITPDATAAVSALDWAPSSPRTAVRGLYPLLTADRTGAPDPALLLAVANGLRATGSDLAASHWARAAMPTALRAGDVRCWARLAALGLSAAKAAGDEDDLIYFAGEEQTRRQLHGDKITVAAALAAATLTTGETATREPEPAAGEHGQGRTSPQRVASVRAEHRPWPADLIRRAQLAAYRVTGASVTSESGPSAIIIATGAVAGAAIIAAGVIGVHLATQHAPPPSAHRTAVRHTAPTVAPGEADGGLGSTPLVTDGSFTGREPTGIYWGTGGSDFVKDIRWASWTDSQAIGYGTAYQIVDCTHPDCAAGTYKQYPATIRLSDPVNGRFIVLVETTSAPGESTTVRLDQNPDLSMS